MERWKTFNTTYRGKIPTDPTKQRAQTVWQVSDHGQVRKIYYPSGEIKPVNLTLSGGQPGNRYPCLPSNEFKYAHKLVARYFVANPDNKPQVDHIDGNKRNNHYTNLRWVTASENMKAAFRLGLRSKHAKEYLCPHCNKLGKGNAMFRWHFENCKVLKQND